RRRPGERIALRARRGGQLIEIGVVLAEEVATQRFRSDPGDMLSRHVPQSPGMGMMLGWRTHNGAAGVEVTEVTPRSPASSAQLGPGDRILSINGVAPR